ncbi:MAG: GGDEF domain-containing protein [Lachnospiraceae bacterium]|nr:GGDEF domain-containing protein [Lachnospiraceae bacterium]
MLTRERLYKDIFYMGISKEQFYDIKQEVIEDNRQTVCRGSICSAVFWALSLMLTRESEAFLACVVVFAVALAFSLFCFWGAQVWVRRNPQAIKIVVSIFSYHIFAAGIGIAYFQPDVRTASMIAFAIIVPTLVIKNMITDVVMEALAIVAYVIICRNVIEPHIYYWGLQNLIIFGVAGVLMGLVLDKERCERFLYAESAKELVEVQKKYAYCDPLTGLQNRRAFEEELKSIVLEQPKNFSIVMLDLNGLKKANDTFGHDAGDELIKATAKCLRESFVKEERIYRIGGDEFSVIHLGHEDEIQHCFRILDQKAADWHGKYIHGFTISYGVASRDTERDVHSVVKLADEKMYECKRNYYKSYA